MELDEDQLHLLHKIIKIKDIFLCPIGKSLMTNPFISKYGHTQDYKNIVYWVKSNSVCPITKKQLKIEDLYPNILIKNQIQDKYGDIFKLIFNFDNFLKFISVNKDKSSDFFIDEFKLIDNSSFNELFINFKSKFKELMISLYQHMENLIKIKQYIDNTLNNIKKYLKIDSLDSFKDKFINDINHWKGFKDIKSYQLNFDFEDIKKIDNNLTTINNNSQQLDILKNFHFSFLKNGIIINQDEPKFIFRNEGIITSSDQLFYDKVSAETSVLLNHKISHGLQKISIKLHNQLHGSKIGFQFHDIGQFIDLSVKNVFRQHHCIEFCDNKLRMQTFNVEEKCVQESGVDWNEGDVVDMELDANCRMIRWFLNDDYIHQVDYKRFSKNVYFWFSLVESDSCLQVLKVERSV